VPYKRSQYSQLERQAVLLSPDVMVEVSLVRGDERASGGAQHISRVAALTCRVRPHAGKRESV